jgi:hypothetical protein
MHTWSKSWVVDFRKKLLEIFWETGAGRGIGEIWNGRKLREGIFEENTLCYDNRT